MTRKLLSIIMCVLLIMPFAILSASAQSETLYMKGPEYVRAIRLPEDEVHISKGGRSATLIPRNSFNGNDAFRFFTALNANQKTAYNQIVEAKAGLTLAADSEKSVKIPLHFYLTESEMSSFWVQDVMDVTIQGALASIIEDYPEYFWLGGYGWEAGASWNSSMNKYDAVITVNIALDESAYANWGVVKNYYNGLMSAVDSFKITGANRYQQLKAIHDRICQMVEYDTDFNNPIAHQPTSVFFEPFQPVCEGYAEAFKLLCDKVGIPCIGVVGDASGEAHKWNYVKMEDGKWYGMDLTWDDQGDILYDFFLVGSNTKDAFFGQATFGSSHTPTGEEFSGADFTLTYPTLSTTSYSLVVPNINSKLSVNAQRNMLYIEKGAILQSQFFALANYSTPTQISGQTVTVSGATTDATVTVKNGSLTREYTVVRWGDITADNQVNNNDYLRAKTVLQGTYNLNSEAKLAAGDFNGDGVIDAFDMFRLDEYIRG